MKKLFYLLFLSFLQIQLNAVHAQRLPAIALWHQGAPYGNPEGGAEKDSVYEQTGDHLISNINDPSVAPFLPEKENATECRYLKFQILLSPGEECMAHSIL
jgi:hypothetical protein